MSSSTPRAARRDAPATLAGSDHAEFRVDRDRIAASPFFARLGGVTQVVGTTDTGLLHNRLTHSLKVAQVARSIAHRINDQSAELVDTLGGCDHAVAEAAGLAHDLGHPPFGHLGEQVLDRLARERFGLVDGFEGNAQTFRILTTTDVRGPSGVGLDLTAAVRAAVLKYPWARLRYPAPHPMGMSLPPRGAGQPPGAAGTGSVKFSAYVTELDDVEQARTPFIGIIAPWQQTIEASVMDTADDIAYAIHDLTDFHRIGVLQHATVAAEFELWTRDSHELATVSDATLAGRKQRPGYALEQMRRRMRAKDEPLFDDEVFTHAVKHVRDELVGGLLVAPFDGSTQAEQSIATFSARWTSRLIDGVTVTTTPSTRSGHVTLQPEQWHEVAVLKFVHNTFVLRRPELALHQRGQAALLTSLVESLDEWLTDEGDIHRIPRRLHDLVELASDEYAGLAANRAEFLEPIDDQPRPSVAELARGRAVVDFVASLTDKQAVAVLDALAGRSSAPWPDAVVL
jgi:dGTPase